MSNPNLIKAVELHEFAALHQLMKREKVDIAFVQETKYLAKFVVDDDSRIVGVVGWLGVGNTIRYKSDFVHPNFRFMGIYTELFRERDRVVRETKTSNYKSITAFCTHLSLPVYLKNGFEIENVKNDITFVRKQI